MNTKIIKFDLNKNLYDTLIAKQGDTKSRFLLFNLLDGSIPFSLENRSVRVYAIKPDRTEVFNDLIITDAAKGYCILELTTQMLAVAGTVKLELMVMEGDKKLTSNIFYMDVKESINSEKAVVSTNEFGTLLTALASLNEYDNYKNEIKNARGGEANLNARLNNFNEQLDNIMYNISQFPRLDNETNDYNRFVRALQSIKSGSTLLFDGTYDFGKQALPITKSIHLKGKNIETSIIKDGLINIKASNVTFSDFFIDAITYADGFKANDVSCENIHIYNCKTNVKSHGYLFESYNGTVKNVLVENCIAENGIHGFINKATNVTFKDCVSNNLDTFGFACISDNIPGEDNIGECINGNIINCKVSNCGCGFATYIRNKHSDVVNFKCENININGMFISGCNQALSLGEASIPDNYLAISNINNVNLSNITITNSNIEFYGIFVNKITNVNVSNLICDSYIKFMEGTSNQVKCKFNQTPYIKTKVNSANISNGNVNLDIYSCKNYDILISSNNTNIINTVNHVDGDEIVLMIRATTEGTWTFGGFGSMFVVPSDLPLSVKFTQCLVSKWLYNRWLNKFVCIGYYISRAN